MMTALGILLFFLGLLFSIWFHELGHFTAARIFKMRVSQFMVGFGKTVWSKQIGETEHGIKAIPLGGYIRIVGMVPPARPGKRAKPSRLGLLIEDAREQSVRDLRPGDETRAFYTKPWWQRAIVMLAGPVQNLILAFILFAIILCGIGVQAPTLKVNEVVQCVIPAGSTATDCKTPITSTGELCTIGADDCALPAASPASRAGFKPGDQIVSVNGEPAGSWDEVTSLIRASPDKPLDFVVQRDGQDVNLTVTPLENKVRVDSSSDEVTSAGYIGLSPTSELTQQPISAVPGQVGTFLKLSAEKLIELPQRVPQLFRATFGGEERDANGPIGIVGVGRLSGEILDLPNPPAERIAFFLSLLASLNMVLFLFNLVPLYPLDGGHVAGAFYEGIRNAVNRIRGRPNPGPVDIARLMPVAYVVASVFIVLSGVLLLADIINPITLNSQ